MSLLSLSVDIACRYKGTFELPGEGESMEESDDDAEDMPEDMPSDLSDLSDDDDDMSS